MPPTTTGPTSSSSSSSSSPSAAPPPPPPQPPLSSPPLLLLPSHRRHSPVMTPEIIRPRRRQGRSSHSSFSFPTPTPTSPSLTGRRHALLRPIAASFGLVLLLLLLSSLVSLPVTVLAGRTGYYKGCHGSWQWLQNKFREPSNMTLAFSRPINQTTMKDCVTACDTLNDYAFLTPMVNVITPPPQTVTLYSTVTTTYTSADPINPAASATTVTATGVVGVVTAVPTASPTFVPLALQCFCVKANDANWNWDLANTAGGPDYLCDVTYCADGVRCGGRDVFGVQYATYLIAATDDNVDNGMGGGNAGNNLGIFGTSNSLQALVVAAIVIGALLFVALLLCLCFMCGVFAACCGGKRRRADGDDGKREVVVILPQGGEGAAGGKTRGGRRRLSTALDDEGNEYPRGRSFDDDDGFDDYFPDGKDGGGGGGVAGGPRVPPKTPPPPPPPAKPPAVVVADGVSFSRTSSLQNRPPPQPQPQQRTGVFGGWAAASDRASSPQRSGSPSRGGFLSPRRAGSPMRRGASNDTDRSNLLSPTPPEDVVVPSPAAKDGLYSEIMNVLSLKRWSK
ncbi:hypothetical protein DFJ73DRAFT_792405 [Zopfochytrium polystomum]|nr:hypothetical protein DFJ73DRAFT_792405 [Zopfochytrium polystomum]